MECIFSKLIYIEYNKTNIVKVVADAKDQALYFSRAKIPFQREDVSSQVVYYKHIGLYLYSDEALDKIAKFSPSTLEEVEKLEQLTFLFNGLKVQVKETQQEGIGIDFLEDLELAEKTLKESSPLNFDLIE
jgi:3-deoxy-manno-octulosonate cytidylyltransferase (CMP-KDO synthetase)